MWISFISPGLRAWVTTYPCFPVNSNSEADVAQRMHFPFVATKKSSFVEPQDWQSIHRKNDVEDTIFEIFRPSVSGSALSY